MKLIRSLELKKNRKRENLFVAEGPKVVGDLLRGGYLPHSIFSTGQQIEAGGRRYEVQNVTEDELRRISFLQHPQEVLAVLEMPGQGRDVARRYDSELVLALDGVQDPGNMGTIIRIADWFGIDTIFCSPDTADAWAPKVVQATMGSIARVHIIYGELAPLLDEAAKADIPVYGTLLDGQNIYEEQLTPGGIIIMGNEGNGISAPIRERITRRLLIPDFHQGPTADSLNVAIATAITCSEFRRRL